MQKRGHSLPNIFLVFLEFSNMYVVTNVRKKIRTITGGPWWTQIKVALIQKGLLDNQNPGFCMGWPGLYLMDSIEHSRSVCALVESYE